MPILSDRLGKWVVIIGGGAFVIFAIANAPEHRIPKQLSTAEWCANQIETITGRDATDGELISCLAHNAEPSPARAE